MYDRNLGILSYATKVEAIMIKTRDHSLVHFAMYEGSLTGIYWVYSLIIELTSSYLLLTISHCKQISAPAGLAADVNHAGIDVCIFLKNLYAVRQHPTGRNFRCCPLINHKLPSASLRRVVHPTRRRIHIEGLHVQGWDTDVPCEAHSVAYLLR